MRKGVAISLLMLLIHQSVYAAGDPNEAMKKLVKDLDTYPAFIQKEYEKDLHSFFVTRGADFLTSVRDLQAAMQESLTKVTALQSSWKMLRASIQIHPERAQDLSVDALQTQELLEIEQYRLNWIADELDRVASEWDLRCRPERLTYASSYFNPKGLFPIYMNQFGELAPHMPKTTVTISTSLSGPVMNAGTSSGMASGNSRDGAIVAGSTVAGAAVGAVAGGVVSFGILTVPAAQAGAIIGFAVGTVVSAVFDMFDAGAALNEYHQLSLQAASKMSDSVSALAVRHDDVIRTVCEMVLKDDDSTGLSASSHEAAKSIRLNTAPSIQNILNKIRSDRESLLDRYLLSLEALKEDYFPRLKSEYLQTINTREDLMSIWDAQAQDAWKNQIGSEVDGLSNEADPVKLASNQQTLWSDLLRTDAQVQPDSTGFLIQARGIRVWNKMLSDVRKAVQP